MFNKLCSFGKVHLQIGNSQRGKITKKCLHVDKDKASSFFAYWRSSISHDTFKQNESYSLIENSFVMNVWLM